MTTLRLAAVLALGCGFAAPALAQEAPAEEPPALTVTGFVGGFSDYRFRGVSQTDENFAIQGSINLNHKSGFYLGAWASNVDYAESAELDIYAGYTKTFGSVTLDGGFYGYLYPGESSLDYFELYGSAKFAVGAGSLKGGIAYAPDQDNTTEDNWYFYGDAAYPVGPVTLKGHLGYTDGFFSYGESNYLDWSVGADFTWKNLTLGVAYVDTDLPSVQTFDSTVVFSLSAAF